MPPRPALQSPPDALPATERFPSGRSITSRSITHPQAPADAGGPALVTLDGRYHVLERIAAGGMGEVFRAHDAVLAREVAIKVLHRSLAGDAGFVERFRREARAAATLNHQNIVAVYDWGGVDGVYFMVMEFVRGRGVRDLLNANGRLAPAQAAQIVRETLRALEHAHGHGIVHRDLKPENILLTDDGVVKLTDMGLARAYADGTATGTGQVTGTVQYLAPEQIRGEPADPRSDLYSLGVVTFELLTGRLPFSGETPMSIAYKHLSDRVPPPSRFAPDIQPELDGFVLSATDRDRELRPESAREMRRDLETLMPSLGSAPSLAAVVADLPPSTIPTSRTEAVAATTTATIPRLARARRRRFRRLLGWVLAIAVIAAAAWGTWTYAVPHRSTVPSLAGSTVAAAQAELGDLGLLVRVLNGRYSELVDEGEVLEQRPPAGAVLTEGEQVTLIPSLGPPPVAVPHVAGSTLDQARAILRQGGLLVGEVRRRFDPKVAEGRVVSQTPAGGQLPKGSAVDLVVSKGHAPVDVPDVVGLPQKKAVRTLRHAGFDVEVADDFSTKVDKGRVIAVAPDPGQTVGYGSSVTITVSLGPERFPCPTFAGLTEDAARALADRWGLGVTFIPVPGTDGTNVLSQLPGAGQTVRYGATIALYMA